MIPQFRRLSIKLIAVKPRQIVLMLLLALASATVAAPAPISLHTSVTLPVDI